MGPHNNVNNVKVGKDLFEPFEIMVSFKQSYTVAVLYNAEVGTLFGRIIERKFYLKSSMQYALAMISVF